MKLLSQPIEQNWDKIKDLVTTVIEGTRCRPEDIYAACRYGHAHLFMSDDGFMILQEQTHVMDKAKVLYIWVAHRFDNKVGLINEYKDEVLEIAKSIGAKRISFSTTRLGFSKVVPEGYRVSDIIYEMEI